MKRSLALVSLVMFAFSVLFLVGWTIYEPAVTGLSTTSERIVTVALLVLPPGIGALFGTGSLLYREGHRRLALAGVLLNSMFALFHLAIVLFAG